ncbi:uncharacterized protein E0L32_004043 [Thyridium curvatum]|uniref:Cytochrome P450 n=1 Tax=Thyridium curvatum TaxID=1093900 RepID=A0A507BCK0_9PEZI|nr:uncharacterized protein E0L32_004043 [Thyridium curvatum]TPX16394.1 hypothetical protein E0L32_004043 [Thyridium curvatum]
MRHHPVFGHLEVVGKLMSKIPSDAHGDYMMVMILDNWRELFPGCDRCPPVAYVDAWPFSPPMAISLHPDVSAQFTQQFNLDKPPEQNAFLYPLTKNLDLSSSNGPAWKVRRRRMNLALSPQTVMARVPDLLEEVAVFVSVLRQKASKDGSWGNVFPLQRLCTLLTLDVIGKYILDIRMHEQTSPMTPFSKSMIDTLSRLRFFVTIANVFDVYNPWWRYKMWSNTRAMDNFLLPFIHQRLDDRARLEAQGKAEDASGRPRTLVENLVKSMAEDKEDESTFIPYALGETKHTFFAGHETSAFTIAYVYLILSQKPEVLARLRKELDEVLGSDAASALRASPHLLNSLAYTNAVIKETMRIHTNVGTLRQGTPNFNLYGPPGSGFEGICFPTEGCVVWDGNFAIHRHPDVWERPLEFIPERWLTTDENDPLYPPKNAWRSFVQGARNCVGQHLAMTEIKMVLAMTVREFDIECAWDEWDALKGRKGKTETIWGERCYQISKDGMPHVKDDMPVHVRLRDPSQ